MSDVIEEFYKQQEHLHDSISINELRLICNSPFKFTKEVINRGTLKNIRLQYFGVFEVSPSRVKYSLKNLEENFPNPKKATRSRGLEKALRKMVGAELQSPKKASQRRGLLVRIIT